jgi:hypothetical protein
MYDTDSGKYGFYCNYGIGLVRKIEFYSFLNSANYFHIAVFSLRSFLALYFYCKYFASGLTGFYVSSDRIKCWKSESFNF